MTVEHSHPSVGNSLVITPHPVSLHGQRVVHGEAALFLPGEVLGAMLERHEIYVGQQWVVSLGGVDVPEQHWHRVRPKHGHLIECRRVPQGDVVKLVAVVALAYFTFGAGGLGAGGLFASGGAIGGGFLGAGIAYVAGSLIINKLLGPKPPSQAAQAERQTVNPTYSLQGGRNRGRMFEPLGLVLGEPYCVPDLGAQSYTHFSGEFQFLTQIFHLGLNCASLNTLRIGETALENYQNVSLFYSGFSGIADTGFPSGSVDTIAGALLVMDGAQHPVVRTSSVDAVQLAIDLEANLYSTNDATGAFQSLGVVLILERRLVGTVTWEPFLGEESQRYQYQYNATSKPLRLTYQVMVPLGQYEVRVTKVTPDQEQTNYVCTVQWSALKTYQADLASYSGQSRLAIQIQASGQLNGSLDEVNCMLRAKPMPFWNGSAWVTATTRDNGLANPGAQILMLLRGIYNAAGRKIAGLGLQDSQIDIESLKGFMDYCRVKGFKYDLYLQENTSIGELIESIAAAGMGSRSWHTGKLGVIWFSNDQPVEAVLNMTTVKTKSFSVDYDLPKTADEIVFQYYDRNRNNDVKPVRVKAPGVLTPTQTATQTMQGITEEAHAAVLARFSMAQNVFQRKTVNCEVDLEHMTFRRGTVMAVSHDLTQWGYGGRVQGAVNVGGLVTLTLDDEVPAVSSTGGASRYIGVRIPGEANYRIFPVQAFTGNSKTVTLATAWPGGIAVPGDTTGNPAHDTIWIYDFKATPGQKLRVSDIKPIGNLDGARVSLVTESDEFWDYVWNGAYTPPPNTSQLQPLPIVSNLRVTEQLNRQGNTFYTTLTASFDVAGSYRRTEIWGALNEGPLNKLGETDARSFSWEAGLADTWLIETRPFSQLQRAGARLQTTYSIIGLTEKPPKPAGVALTQTQVFAKPVNMPADLDGYWIRSLPGVVIADDAAFARGTKAHEGIVTDFPWDFTTRVYGIQTVMVVAVDTTGNFSVPGYASLDFGQPDTNNIGQSRIYRDEVWPGAVTGGALDAGDLAASVDPAANIDALDDMDLEADIDATLYLDMRYVAAAFTPQYGGGTLVLDLDFEGSLPVLEYRVDGSTVTNIDALANLDTEADLDGPTGEFQPWPGALAVQRDVGYTIAYSAAGGSSRARLKKLTANLVLQRLTQDFAEMSINAGGTRLSPLAGTPARKWVQIQSVTMTPKSGSGATSSRYLNLSNTLGPLMELVNSSGVAVTGPAIATVGGLADV